MSHHTLDARRLLCPLPVIRTQERVRALAAGDVLEVLGTDPGIQQDIPAWCRVQGHAVLSIEALQNEYRIVLRVGG